MPIGQREAWTRSAYEQARQHPAEGGQLADLVGYLRALEEPGADVGDLERRALELLVKRSIHPRRSKLTCIYEDLHTAAAKARDAAGEVFAATWERVLLGECNSTHTPPPAEHLALAGKALAERFAQSAKPFPPAAASSVMALRQHRLRGEHLEALALAERASSDRDAAFQAALCQVHLSADTAPLDDYFERFDDQRDDERAWAALYELAIPKKWAAERFERRRPPLTHAALGPALAALGKCHQQDVPTHQRLAHAGLDLCALAGAVDHEAALLLLAGVSRWLFQAKKQTLVRLVGEAYQALSLQLSSGRSRDNLALLVDLTDAWRDSDSTPPRVRVEGGQLRRTATTASVLAELTARLGVQRTRRLFGQGARAKRIGRREDAALWAVLAKSADTLKGPLLKLVQHLAYAGLNLPPDVHRQLEAAHASSTPMDADVIRTVLREELGSAAQPLLHTLGDSPIGVGSIGQVHAATLPDGREVAIKVQYPEVEDAIRHDFWNLGLLVPVLRVLRPKVDWRGLLRSLQATLIAECDYRKEAVFQQSFRAHLEGDPVLRVPKVLDDLCSRRVLTMERVHGATLQDFADNSAYAERREVAEALLRLLFAYVDERFTWTDPHPGNYLITAEHVYVLDFGCVASWEPATRLAWVRLGRGMMQRDEAALRKGLRELGFPVDPERFDYREFVEKFHPDFYTPQTDEGGVALHTPQVVTQQLLEFFSRRSPNYHNIQIPPELLMGLRAYYGTVYILALLRTGIDVNGERFQNAVDATVAAAEATVQRSTPNGSQHGATDKR